MYTAGFSLSFKVDSDDVKVGSMESSVEGNFRLSLPHFTHFPPKEDGSNIFLAGCLMRTLTQPLFAIYFFSLAYKFCFLIELHMKEKL